MVNTKNRSSSSPPGDGRGVPQRRALSREGSGAPGERNSQRELLLSEPGGITPAVARVERSFFAPRGLRELDPRTLPDLVPLVPRPDSARSTQTTANSTTEGAMPLTRAILRAERMAKHAVISRCAAVCLTYSRSCTRTRTGTGWTDVVD